MRISLTSTDGGWETAYITARATSSATSAVLGWLEKNGVSTAPGSMSVTRTPVPLSSWRAPSPIAVTAHLVAEYSDPGSARRPATEPVSSRWPLDAVSALTVARMVSAAPYTLVSTIERQNSGDSLRKPRLAPKPALAK